MIPIVLVYLLRFCTAGPPELNYVVNMDSQMEGCDEESLLFVDTAGLTVGRYNETIAYMTGHVKFLKAVGPNTSVDIVMQKEASGKYETMFTHEIHDLCDEVSKGPESDYYAYLKYFGIPDQCPFEADDYPVQDFIVDTDDLPLNSNTAGRYQCFLTLYKTPEKDCDNAEPEKEFLFCLTMKLVIEID